MTAVSTTLAVALLAYLLGRSTLRCLQAVVPIRHGTSCSSSCCSVMRF